MAIQKVDNNVLNPYNVLVDLNSAGTELQVMRIDQGVGTIESRVSTLNPLRVQQTPNNSGGLLVYSGFSAASNNAASIKGGRGVLYSVAYQNNSASVRYMKLYNKATAPNPAVDVPIMRFVAPSRGVLAFSEINGIEFSVGIGFAVTGGAGDADNTAIAALEFTWNIQYI